MSAAETLRRILSPLCSTDEDRLLLDGICAVVIEVSEDTVIYSKDGDDDWEVNYEPAKDVPSHDGVPESFRQIASVVGALFWDGGGPEVGFAIEDDGASSADPWLFAELKSDAPDEHARISAAGSVVASFMAGQEGLFFDPTRSLANGESALAYLSHGGGGWVPVKSVDHLNYKQILLRMLSDEMVEGNSIPEISF